MKHTKEQYIWALLRLSMGWIFLWAFLDKLFGLGFSTVADKSWLSGVSPTAGFLRTAVRGPFTSFYHSLAGSALVDWLYMLGLLLVGLFLILGILVRPSSATGALMLFLFYTAAFIPPKQNPFLDEHIVYIIVLLGLAISNSGECFGLGKWWSKTSIVQKHKFLQ